MKIRIDLNHSVTELKIRCDSEKHKNLLQNRVIYAVEIFQKRHLRCHSACFRSRLSQRRNPNSVTARQLCHSVVKTGNLRCHRDLVPDVMVSDPRF